MKPDEIARRRRALDVSQEELARLVGCTTRHIQNLESVKDAPEFSSVRRRVRKTLEELEREARVKRTWS